MIEKIMFIYMDESGDLGVELKNLIIEDYSLYEA